MNKCDHTLDRHEFYIEFHEVCECGVSGNIIDVLNVGVIGRAIDTGMPLTNKEINRLKKQFVWLLKGLNNDK
jgi:hypothetical protein|tara:strand:+ start:158 stop:373 length:216 start_codon:yes stop_codon:yes gene_type:complete